MATNFTVPLSNIIKELSLDSIYLPCNPNEVLISSMDVNRPGLELNGYFDYYDKSRILIIGNAETAFLQSCTPEQRKVSLETLFSKKPPAVIIARSIKPEPELLSAAENYEVPVFGTPDTTSSLVAALVSYMNVELAPRITRHGVLVEVYGEGILLIGDSGVGKSETAIELIKRGHRLIAATRSKSAVFLLSHLLDPPLKISGILLSFAALVSLTRAEFLVWAPLKSQKRLIWSSILRFGIIPRSMTEWESTVNILRY